MNTLYTVSRCRKDDTLFGLAHGSDDGNITVCGQTINENWFITHNTFDGVITCKKCLAIMMKYSTIPQRMEIK